jgi:formylglycine-generating enzyme required for sulfatase activity
MTAVDELDRKYQNSKQEIEQRFAREFESSVQGYRDQIAKLRKRTYLAEGAKAEFVQYDADNSLLTATVDEERYRFTISPERARELHGRLSSARVEQFFAEDPLRKRVLVDPVTGDRFPGISEQAEREQREAEARAAKEAARQRTARLKLEFVRIPAGEFMMGSNSGGEDEKPVHRVRITRPFEMGKYEVTQAQWEAVMGSNPSRFKGPGRPVEEVSWNDAQEFLGKLNAVGDGYRYRMPSEAEWEYAARAGTTGDHASNLDAMAWYDANSGSQTHPVGAKQPNGWGLHDMHGNVWEWCQDWYDQSYYRSSPAADPTGPASGTSRVLRGGSWVNFASYARSAYRGRSGPAGRTSVSGSGWSGN